MFHLKNVLLRFAVNVVVGVSTMAHAGDAVHYRSADIDQAEIFYRAAGPKDAPNVAFRSFIF